MISRRRSSVVMATVSRDSTSALRVRVRSVCGVASAPDLRSFADLFGELVALGLEGFDLCDGVAAFAVDGGEVGQDLTAGSMPRARSFSSTKGRLARTNARSIIGFYFSGFGLKGMDGSGQDATTEAGYL